MTFHFDQFSYYIKQDTQYFEVIMARGIMTNTVWYVWECKVVFIKKLTPSKGRFYMHLSVCVFNSCQNNWNPCCFCWYSCSLCSLYFVVNVKTLQLFGLPYFWHVYLSRISSCFFEENFQKFRVQTTKLLKNLVLNNFVTTCYVD